MHTAFGASPGTTLDATYKAVSGTSFGETSTLLTSRIQFMPNGRFASGRDFAAVGSGAAAGKPARWKPPTIQSSSLCNRINGY